MVFPLFCVLLEKFTYLQKLICMAQIEPKEIRVFSSNIKTAAYDMATKTLLLTFINRPNLRYSYFHVSPKVWTRFVQADSKGKYFADYIRDQYAYTRRMVK